LPVVQDRGEGKKPGRDHNTEGFSLWMAGGGIRRGHVHGATDDFGHRAVEDIVTQHDFHSTLLHQLGLDPRSLHVAGRKRLEKEYGHVIHGVIA